MGFRAKINAKEVMDWLRVERSEIPFATSLALNWTAREIKKDIKKEMKRVFKNPTRGTLNSLFTDAARKNKLHATVGLKDNWGKGNPASAFLSAQIYGGKRELKRHEKALQRVGVLPKGKVTVPGYGAKLNKYGNITGGQYTRIISALRAFTEERRATGGTAYIVGPILNRPAGKKTKMFANKKGVFERIGGKKSRKVRQLLGFVDSPHYKKRLDYFGILRKTYNKHYSRLFDRAYKYAVATKWKKGR